MRKILIVVDMQNDFVTGALGSEEAQKILSGVRSKIELYHKNAAALQKMKSCQVEVVNEVL